MLAFKDAGKDTGSTGKVQNSAVFELQAANDQLAKPVLAGAAGAEPSLELAREPDAASSSDSWLQDWTRLWTDAANTMIGASVASLDAVSTMSAAAAATAPKPAAPEVSLWSQPASSTRPRSWYRPPTPNLLDPTAWGFPAPLAVYGVPVTPQMAMGFNPMQSPMAAMMQAMQPSPMAGWPSFGTGFGQPSPFANPFARQPENPMAAWMASFAPQPVNPWVSLTKAMTGALSPVPYSSYRSDSGHAVAQIAEPAAKASSAHEAAIAIMNLFVWPTPSRAN
jgi:hypothetical protein